MGMSPSQPQPVTQGTMGNPTGTGGGMQVGRPQSSGSSIMPMPASPTKNYGPVGDMLGSAQNQVNPQSSPTGTMNNLMGSLPGSFPGQNTAPQQNGPTVLTSTVPPTSNQYTDPNSSGMPQHVRDGMSPGQFPTNYNPQQNYGGGGQGTGDIAGWDPAGGPNAATPSMRNPSFMPMGNAGFMPMGNAGFMPMGFGQMPQQPQMPTFGGPRGGKSPQGGGNSNGTFGSDGRWVNY